MTLLTLAKKCLPLLVIVVAVGCDKDDPAAYNQTVRPRDFLTDATYKRITVDIIYVDGFQPEEESVQNLINFMLARLNKPQAVGVAQHPVPSPGVPILSVDMLNKIESQRRTQHTDGNHVTAYLYFADADYPGNSGSHKTLGVAYNHSSMAVFKKSLLEFAGGVGQPSIVTLETAVMLHELCHILGLVNNGTPMEEQHQDASHQGHCNDQDCLMHYLAETSGIAANLFGGSVPVLDANCLADLKANGGK